MLHIKFLLTLYTEYKKRIKNETKDTAAQLAFALTNKLSKNIIKKIGTEKISKNLELKSNTNPFLKVITKFLE